MRRGRSAAARPLRTQALVLSDDSATQRCARTSLLRQIG
ncbi:hypothetical protein BURMUCF2_3164 [Burkholderia multivorans CF2]|nr:hypothetical protein BURMUCF2_3164 [Burkholderia multivorans CF2]